MDLFEEDDDYEIIQYRRLYTVHERINHILAWDGHDFRVRFRLGRNVVRNLLEYIEDEIASQTICNNAVTPINKLLLALRFYATGDFPITAGDFIGVSKSTACLIIRDVIVWP
ncbi:unnamed protein product [Macrosiphum euphorbiae]|uniref:Nuclease HARBI1 n=1 Tax=Macrosiphum euphorbiae TaxID=13131 RepID=A0AAV0XVA6_9HEMI|nr:unnamed protein product [Macrosiphum euphorbiae]